MRRLAEVKDSLDIEVKQNFIDPLQNLCDKDLKEIQVPACPPRGRQPLRCPGASGPDARPCPSPLQHHLKKLEGRRLDFDYKKKRQGKIADEELRQALEKFEESKEVAETSMHNLLETDVGAAPARGGGAGAPRARLTPRLLPAGGAGEPALGPGGRTAGLPPAGRADPGRAGRQAQAQVSHGAR